MLKGFKKLHWRIIPLVFLLFSCSKYQQIVKSTDYGLKFEKAVVYYEKKDFYRALPLFEELLNIYKGTTKAQEIYYYYAYCHYGMGEYLLASYHFKNYTSTFPKGIHAEECLYMNAYCFYKESLPASLDQETTLKAINEFQLFANLYLQSSRIARCNELIDELRLKLEIKSYEIGKLYYKTQNYKAAIVSMNNTLKDYPLTKHNDELLYLIFKSNYLMALNSIEQKKTERLNEAIEAYNKYINFSKEKKYAKDAENVFANVKNELNKINNQIPNQ
jgi:outer membrane protein assembly factor BamD